MDKLKSELRRELLACKTVNDLEATLNIEGIMRDSGFEKWEILDMMETMRIEIRIK